MVIIKIIQGYYKIIPSSNAIEFFNKQVIRQEKKVLF